MSEDNPQNPKPTGPSNVNITGVEPSIISEITKAQSQAMDSFTSEIKKISKSLKVLETSIPESIVKSMKDFTKEFNKTTKAEQQRAGAAPTNVGGHSSSASVATSNNPSGEQAGAPEVQQPDRLRSTFKSGEGPLKSAKSLKQYGPGSEAERTYGPSGIFPSEEAIEGAGTVFGADTEKLKEARGQVARFAHTPQTKLGKFTTMMESAAGVSEEGPFSILNKRAEDDSSRVSKTVGKIFGQKRRPDEGDQETEGIKKAKETVAKIVPGPAGTSEGGTGAISRGSGENEDAPTIPTLDNQKLKGPQYAKTAAGILRKAGDFIGDREGGFLGGTKEGTMSSRGDLLARSMSSGATMLEQAGTKYLPYANMAKNAVQSVYNPLHKFGESNVAMGVQQGISPRTGDFELPGFLGGLGFRSNSMIFNEAARQGAKMKFRDIKESRKSGLTREQADEITGNIASMGYKYGTKREGAAFQTMSGLFRDNPQFENPQTYQLMDAMTRYRPVDSMKEFDSAMRDMNATVKNTNLSLGDMQKAAIEMVSLNRSMGGTATSGVQLSNAITSATGISADKYKPAMQSGFFQSNLALSTGLAPWEQGLAGNASKLQALRKTLRDVGGMAPNTNQYYTDPITGEKTKISAEDRTASWQGKVLGIGDGDPATVKTMVKSMEQAYASEDVLASLQNKKTLSKDNWQRYSKYLKSGGWDKKSIEEIEKAGKSDKGIGGTEKATRNMEKKLAELSSEKSKPLMDRQKAGEGRTGASETVNGVTITLDGNAAKLFKLKNNDKKNNTNNGGPNGAQSYVDGYSDTANQHVNATVK